MKGCSFENEIDNSNGIQKITLKGKNVGGIVNVLCIDLSQSNLDYDMEYILENFGDYCFNQTFVQMSGIQTTDICCQDEFTAQNAEQHTNSETAKEAHIGFAESMI